MKKIFTILAAVILTATLWAQSPQKLSYQAVIRNSNGQLVTSHTVGMKISILQGTTPVYSETQTPGTNANGLVSIEIGGGTGFDLIDWSNGTYFIKTETDPTGGTNYTISGTSQLLSVPYALFSEKAADLNYASAPKAGDILYNNGTSWQLLSKGVNGQTLRLDNGLPKWGEQGNALPLVTTNAVTDILQTAAASGGNIIATGYSDVTARGVCWSINQNPTVADAKTVNGSGIGNFNSALTNLLSNTTYYARAYATNLAGTAYGNQVTFKTFLNVVFPTVTTTDITNITANAVTSGGNVTATGGAEVAERGVCWSDHQNPVVTDSKTTDGTGTGQFLSQISGLIPGTYYARAYATNSAGTGYGNMVNFSTEKTLPVLTTKAITEISAMGAVSGGNITSAGGGTISERGICWSESPNPAIANDKTTSPTTTSSFSAAIAKASPGTTYYLRAYATNEIGTGYGDQKTFTTSDAQYFTSFESGMTPPGWSGTFTVSNETAFDGSFSFKSLINNYSEETYTTTLTSTGQLSFYYSFNDGGSIDIYIDDVLISNLPSDGTSWKQVLVPINSGTHKIKWYYTPIYYGGSVYIDQIIITK
jgi:hypothetical protein